MVTLRDKIHGLDFQENGARLATVVSASGLLTVENLQELPSDELKSSMFDTNAELYFSVPDNEAIVKRIRITGDHTLDPEKLALFEFVSALPEDSYNYYLETYRLNGERQRLAVAYHRFPVQERISHLEKIITRPSGFRLRSLAMIEGFRKFCRPEGGELICLVNIDRSQPTLAFLNRGATVAVGAIELVFPFETEPLQTKSCLIDITAFVGFRLASLFSDGFTAPLSLAVLSGEMAHDSLARDLSQSLRINAVLPNFREEVLTEGKNLTAHKFLVSLGLTVVT